MTGMLLNWRRVCDMKFFYLQIKRVMRILPMVLLVAAILFGSLFVVYTEATKLLSSEETEVRLKVAMVGSVDDTYLQLGLAAVQTFDSSRMALDIVTMEESQAKRAMERGDIAAMVVIPEGFIDKAFYGEILPLKYVTTSGAVGLVSILKDEITAVINDLLIHAQKGIYGAGNAAEAGGADANKVVGSISLEYVDFILDRSKMYSASEVVLEGDLGLRGHLLSGLCMLLLLLSCLPFAPVRVRRDHSLSRMLASKRRGVTGQMLCEYGAFFLGLLVITALALGALAVSGMVELSLVAVLHMLPVVAVTAALSFMLYEFTGDLISGVLLQFFVILVLSLISGCLYPIYFFPESIQKLAHYVPTGMGREQISGLLTGVFSVRSSLALMGYTAGFFLCALGVRKYRTSAVRG